MRLTRATAALAAAALAAPAAAAAHGDEVPVSRLSSAWEAQPVVIAIAGLMLLLFAQAFWRLRRRGRADHAPWTRVPMFVAAVALGTLPLLSPLDAVGDEYLLSAHMLQHVLIGDVAPALALVALRGPLVLFLLPPFVLGPLARVGPAAPHARLPDPPAGRARRLGARVRALARPGGLRLHAHAPERARPRAPVVLHRRDPRLDAARRPGPPRRAVRRARTRLRRGCLFAFGTMLSDVLIFSSTRSTRPTRPQTSACGGLSAVRDQQLAGVVMMVEQLLVLGTAAVLLLPLRAGARRRRRWRGSRRAPT